MAYLLQSLQSPSLVPGGPCTQVKPTVEDAFPNDGHAAMWRRAAEGPSVFWESCAERVHWFEKPTRVYNDGPIDEISEERTSNTALPRAPQSKWFVGGKLNISYDCLDKQVALRRGDWPALFYDSPLANRKRTITFRELLAEVEDLSCALRNMGLSFGDRVMVYMPSIPEAVVAMLSCARIGAIHCTTFGGLGWREVQGRLEDATPRMVLLSSCGLESSRVVPYKEAMDLAIQHSSHKPERCVIVQREQHSVELCSTRDALYITWEEMLNRFGRRCRLPKQDAVGTTNVNAVAAEKAGDGDVRPVDSNHPLYIIHTSGTTSTPKGIVRDHAGQLVAGTFAFEHIYDCTAGDVFFAAADIGWILGHSCTVYGPLSVGAATVLYEGKSVGTPNAAELWRVAGAYDVKCLFANPTSLRAMRREDPEGLLMQNFDLKSLKAIFVAGEKLDLTTEKWLQGVLRRYAVAKGYSSAIPIIDNWWQTETGWPITSFIRKGEKRNFQVKPKQGCCGRVIPGWDLRTVDESGMELPRGSDEPGHLVIKHPTPPGTVSTLWRNHDRYCKTYLERFPGYHDTGDLGTITKDGYVQIFSRADDVVKVSALRISTSALEEVIGGHSEVHEAAVVGLRDRIRGQVELEISSRVIYTIALPTVTGRGLVDAAFQLLSMQNRDSHVSYRDKQEE